MEVSELYGIVGRASDLHIQHFSSDTDSLYLLLRRCVYASNLHPEVESQHSA